MQRGADALAAVIGRICNTLECRWIGLLGKGGPGMSVRGRIAMPSEARALQGEDGTDALVLVVRGIEIRSGVVTLNCCWESRDGALKGGIQCHQRCRHCKVRMGRAHRCWLFGELKYDPVW